MKIWIASSQFRKLAQLEELAARWIKKERYEDSFQFATVHSVCVFSSDEAFIGFIG
jgi:hypothetical protein